MTRNFMLKIQRVCGELVGPMLIGIMVGWVSFGVFFLGIDAFKLDYGIVTNVVIACATVVAVIVHVSGLDAQESARRWELRKSIIFKLLENLLEVMALNELRSDLEDKKRYPCGDQLELDYLIKNVDRDWRSAKNSMISNINMLRNVYRPILPNDLMKSLEQFEHNMNELSRNSHLSWSDPFEELVVKEAQILLDLRTQIFEFVEQDSRLN